MKRSCPSCGQKAGDHHPLCDNAPSEPDDYEPADKLDITPDDDDKAAGNTFDTAVSWLRGQIKTPAQLAAELRAEAQNKIAQAEKLEAGK